MARAQPEFQGPTTPTTSGFLAYIVAFCAQIASSVSPVSALASLHDCKPTREAPGPEAALSQHERDRLRHRQRRRARAVERQLGGDQDVGVAAAVGHHAAAWRRGQRRDARIRAQPAGRGRRLTGTGDAHPHAPTADRESARRAGHRDRRRHARARRIDAGHGAADGIDRPDRAGADCDAVDALADVDRARGTPLGIDSPHRPAACVGRPHRVLPDRQRVDPLGRHRDPQPRPAGVRVEPDHAPVRIMHPDLPLTGRDRPRLDRTLRGQPPGGQIEPVHPARAGDRPHGAAADRDQLPRWHAPHGFGGQRQRRRGACDARRRIQAGDAARADVVVGRGGRRAGRRRLRDPQPVGVGRHVDRRDLAGERPHRHRLEIHARDGAVIGVERPHGAGTYRDARRRPPHGRLLDDPVARGVDRDQEVARDRGSAGRLRFRCQ